MSEAIADHSLRLPVSRIALRSIRATALGIVAMLAASAAFAADVRILPVPRLTIYPGDTIAANLIVARNFPAALVGNAAAVEAREALVGKVAKRTLLPGYPIPLNAVAEPDVVTRGTPVQVVFQEGGLTITTYASPLQSGGVGAVIGVRNVESGLTIHGVVQPDGTVRVGRM